jgi:hypothetical protein
MKRNRIRLYFVPKEREVATYMDVFGYTLEDINKFMAIPNDEMVEFPSKSGGHYNFRRDFITHWETIEKEN